MNHHLKEEKNDLILIGKTFGHLGQSCFLKENYSISEGRPPEVNLLNEKNNGETVLNLINKNLIRSAHDVSSGGLITSLSEMAMSAKLGLKISKPRKLRNPTEYFFGEDQSRYILEVKNENLDKVQKYLKNNNIFYEIIGSTQKKYFEIEGEMKLDINDLCKINNQWYNNY